MRIQVSSNVVNGVYSCLELFVLAVFSRCLATIIGCWNIKRIYVDKKELQLTSSIFNHFADLGLTSQQMQVAGLATFSLVLGLMTAGGYSVRGVTVLVSKEVQVANLVKLADEDEIMDLSDHIDSESGLVSGSVLLILDYAYCFTSTSKGYTVYEYTNSLYDITTPKWKYSALRNSTCLTGDLEDDDDDLSSRFEAEYIDEDLYSNPSRVFWSKECEWGVDGTKFPVGKMTEAPSYNSSQCPYPFLEGWCLRGEDGMHCAGVFRYGDEFLTKTLFGVAPPQQRFESVGSFRITRQPASRQIRSMVYLRSSGYIRLATDYDLMAKLLVKKNALIREIFDKRDVTELNILLFSITAGVAISFTFAAGIIALYLWLRVIYFPGRMSYNRFNSALDLMSYAVNVSLKTANQRLRCHEAIPVGVRTSDADVGPVVCGMPG